MGCNALHCIALVAMHGIVVAGAVRYHGGPRHGSCSLTSTQAEKEERRRSSAVQPSQLSYHLKSYSWCIDELCPSTKHLVEALVPVMESNLNSSSKPIDCTSQT